MPKASKEIVRDCVNGMKDGNTLDEMVKVWETRCNENGFELDTRDLEKRVENYIACHKVSVSK